MHGDAGSERRVVLRPGAAMPVLGYAGAVAFSVVAVVITVIAHAGATMPPNGDWAAIGDRLLAGETLTIAVWVLYKLGSQRVILGPDAMRIVTWGLTWTVGRDEVTDVVLSPSALTIKLTDGHLIRPSMFWSSGPGAIYLQAGLFKNAMSRETVRDEILQWRQPPQDAGARGRVRQRRWRVHANLPLLLGLAGVIAAEAAMVTAWW